jgi:hypothetical protein
VVLNFDPNDILNLYPEVSQNLESKTTQENARRIHLQWGANLYGTFGDYMQPGHSQPSDYDTYVGWRNGLTQSGQGIGVFNVWFIDQPGAKSWGETTVIKPGSVVTATAVDGWSYTIIHDPYGIGGDVVQWYTLDPTKRLRPTDLGGANIGEFSVTADLYHDANGNGWDASDPSVVGGEQVRFWVGDLNGDDTGFYRSDTDAIFFNGAAMGNGADHAGSGFEAALSATADPIPEPLTMLGLVLAAGSVVGYIRRRKLA